ncbi:MAG TPA: hypothetical protein VEY51_14720 [Chondromyces sp.]|nr:hypothetical protein [Chondromyces sp.]
MDIVSFSKASKTLKKIQELDQSVVSPLAEDRFSTVDARLDWLEGQANKAITENSKQLDLSQGVFDNTEFVNGKLKLKAVRQIETMESNVQIHYYPSGTYESPVIDLGEEWKETKLVDIIKQIKTGTTDCILEISTSSDGVTFSSYLTLDLSSLPQGRYIKIRATLSALVQPGEVKTLQYSQSPENHVTLNEFTEANGDLKLKNQYTYAMNMDGTLGQGNQFSVSIPKTSFKSIQSIEVK